MPCIMKRLVLKRPFLFLINLCSRVYKKGKGVFCNRWFALLPTVLVLMSSEINIKTTLDLECNFQNGCSQFLISLIKVISILKHLNYMNLFLEPDQMFHIFVVLKNRHSKFEGVKQRRSKLQRVKHNTTQKQLFFG